MSLLPKDDEGITGKVKHLYTLLKATTLTDTTFVKAAEKQGQETGHHQHL
jgi:hypothetical protein